MAVALAGRATLVLALGALAIIALGTLARVQHASVLVSTAPLISTSQATEAKKLFAQSAAVDSQLEKEEGSELSVMNKRMALAQKKLALDQAKVKNVLRRIKKVKTEDTIPNMNLGARAGYQVDVRSGVAAQTHPGYRQQSWPRGFAADAYDFPEDNFKLSPSQLHGKGGDAILDELQAGGRGSGLTKQQRWAEHVLTEQE